MIDLTHPYTLGTWIVKAGNDTIFMSEWQKFARWTAKTFPGAGTAYLLQDTEHPNQFISFGPWENTDMIKIWRESSEFKAFVATARNLCEEFKPRSMRLAAASEG